MQMKQLPEATIKAKSDGWWQLQGYLWVQMPAIQIGFCDSKLELLLLYNDVAEVCKSCLWSYMLARCENLCICTVLDSTGAGES